MIESAKEIVIAMLEHDYISKSSTNEENIENINNALEAIAKQLYNLRLKKFD